MAYHILCVDDDPKLLLGIQHQLKRNYQVSIAENVKTASQIIKNDSVDLIFLDVELGQDIDGIDLIKDFKKADPSLIIIMLSGLKDSKVIVNAITEGASDYLCKPYSHEELVSVIEKNLSIKKVTDKSDALMEYVNFRQTDNGIIGKSPLVKEILEKAKCLRGHDISLLIEGESGTGKEILARHIYHLENNTKRPFIAINCAAIPESLLESEMFGHEKGAFSGADRRKVGKFELANGGDLFLDEINSLKLDLQAKLLRFLQEREFYRLGGVRSIRLSLRVIAATNVNLYEAVQKGLFRQDLYYRIQAVTFRMPPLRQRLEDMEAFVDYFLEKYSPSNNKKQVTLRLMEKLRLHNWPGNIRELESLIRSLVILSPRDVIDVADLGDWLDSHSNNNTKENGSDAQAEAKMSPLREYLLAQEIKYIQRVLKIYKGNISRASRVLEVSRNTLYNRMSRGEFLKNDN